MNRLMAVLLLVACAPALAQGVYKCRDAAGKVTYASQECKLLGLKDAGEVKDTVQTVPAVRPQTPVAKPKPAASKDAAKAPAPEKEAPKQEAKKEPERRCFKTAKGIRCNDVPEESKTQ